MNEELRIDLIRARELSRAGKYEESLEIFDRNYRQSPDEFNQAHRDYYALTVYNAHVKGFKDEDEFFEAVERITEITEQKDTTRNQYCIYTVAVFKVLRHINSQRDYSAFFHWLDKIDPDLLGQGKYKSNGITYSSNLESYYEYSSKAYFHLQEYEKCIEFSLIGLEKVDRYTNFSDIWHYHRMAKALKGLGQYDDAIAYFDKTLEVKKEWYVYRDAAEIFIARRDYPRAMDYLCPAVLSKESSMKKVNLYYLIYRMFDRFNKDLALLHAKLCYSLKLERGARVPEDINALEIDENALNRKDLEKQVRNLWTQYLFKDQELQYGKIAKYVEEKGFGFIKTDDDSIFFHRNDFKGDTIYVGMNVSFYTEKTFDKSKNRKSLKAVYINGE